MMPLAPSRSCNACDASSPNMMEAAAAVLAKPSKLDNVRCWDRRLNERGLTKATACRRYCFPRSGETGNTSAQAIGVIKGGPCRRL